MNPQPLTLEYQSRIIKAKKVATGGLMLLGGGIGGIAMIVSLILGTAILKSPPDTVAPYLGGLAMLLIAAVGILMVICAARIRRNHLRSALLARMLVCLLALPLIALFGMLLIDYLYYDADREELILIFICCVAVFGGLFAVLVELAIVKKAILQGDYIPRPGA